jgi:hypothetical protein
MLRKLFLATILIASPAWGDAVICPLNVGVDHPTKPHQCSRPVKRLSKRVCGDGAHAGRWPDVELCHTVCQTTGLGCLPHLPTPVECCQAGYEVEPAAQRSARTPVDEGGAAPSPHCARRIGGVCSR